MQNPTTPVREAANPAASRYSSEASRSVVSPSFVTWPMTGMTLAKSS